MIDVIILLILLTNMVSWIWLKIKLDKIEDKIDQIKDNIKGE